MKGLIANSSDSTTMPPSSASAPKPFRFLDLPYDIRTIVYRYVPERVKLPLLPDGFRIYYEETVVPPALLQANKFINAELREEADLQKEMELVRKQEPITLVCPLSQIYLASLIVDMLNNSLKNQRQPGKVSALALVVPARGLKSRLSNLDRRFHDIPRNLGNIADGPLLAFLRKSTLSWNRIPAVYIRCLMEGGISAELFGANFRDTDYLSLSGTLDSLGPLITRTDRALNIHFTIVTHSDDQEKALDSTGWAELQRSASKSHVRLLVEWTSGPS